MPRVDSALVDSAFRAKYKRGAILRFYMKCDDPGRPYRYKFGIVLNKNTGEPEALLAITTTKLSRYTSGYFENDIVRVATGSYACFDEPTIINLREVRVESVEALKTLFANGQMSFEGAMDPADMTEIDGKLQASVLIEIKTKKRIV